MREKTKEALETTLVFFRDGKKILLSEKKRSIGSGLLNGFGGKVEVNETVLEAAIREAEEEVGLKPVQMQKKAVISFKRDIPILMHVFVATDWTGEIKESDEMQNPAWYSIGSLPYEKMIPTDKLWLECIFLPKTQTVIKFADDGEPSSPMNCTAIITNFM